MLRLIHPCAHPGAQNCLTCLFDISYSGLEVYHHLQMPYMQTCECHWFPTQKSWHAHERCHEIFTLLQADDMFWDDITSQCIMPANKAFALSMAAAFLLLLVQVLLTATGGCPCCNYRIDKITSPAPLAIKSLIVSWYVTSLRIYSLDVFYSITRIPVA